MHWHVPCAQTSYLRLFFLSSSITLVSLFTGSMSHNQKNYCSPAQLVICPVEGCRKECLSYGGLTQHIQAKHKEYQPGTPPSAAAADYTILDSESSSVNDLEMSIPPDNDPAGASDAFGSESNLDHSIGFDFEIPFLLSSQPDSPSQESEASNVDYHPIING